MSVSIAGLDKAAVIAALYNESACGQGMAALSYIAGDMPMSTARCIVERAAIRRSARESIYFDYVMGRVIKTDIGGDEIDPRLYDRDNGEGACAHAIATLRASLANGASSLPKEGA